MSVDALAARRTHDLADRLAAEVVQSLPAASPAAQRMLRAAIGDALVAFESRTRVPLPQKPGGTS